MHTPPGTRWMTLVAVLPCVAAVVANALPSHATPLPLPAPRPTLVFDQYGVSYPEVGLAPVVEAHFEFRNQGRETVSIEDVEPSCGCLRWHLVGDRRTYRPGESGSVVVRLFTANEQPGPHDYVLNVRSRSGQPRSDRLSFRVTLPERKVTIEPAEVYFYQLHGEPDSRTVYISDHRAGGSGPLRVTSAECRSRQVTVELLPPETDAHGRPRIPIVLSVPAHVAPGREIAYLRVETSDSEFPSLAVPVLIEGAPQISGPPAADAGAVDFWKVFEERRAAQDVSPPR